MPWPHDQNGILIATLNAAIVEYKWPDILSTSEFKTHC